ncbi:SprT-like domain-containing protein [Oscillospiraceae bacterium OttesenSCG-928-F05]|nr:SprT-like domain-containing protein [Oscillospiraceae bacterium OttesenSCG-928-F05]
MKQTVKTSRTAGYLEKMFRAMNDRYFGNQLEEPIITIQSTPRAYGHVTVGKSWRRGQENRHELNIGAGTLDRPIEYVAATLLHEMVHLWNIREGIQDCSRGGAYHNKKFRDAAASRDLSISYDQRIGWSITEPTPELCDFIIEQGWTDIDMARQEWSFTTRGKGTGNTTGGTDTPTGRTSSTRKYICPCCGQSVRATKEIRIKCMDCDVQMITK